MEPDSRRLFTALLLNFAVFGITVTIFGATIPKIIRQFEWSYLITGMVLSSSAVGYFVSSFISGFLVPRFGPKRIVLLGLLLQSIGLAFFGALPNVVFNLCAIFLVGLGHGGTEVVSNFCVVRIEKAGQSRLMNLMHAAFPVGAILGPILVGWLIAAGQPWQTMFRVMAVLTLAIAGGLSLLSFKSLDVDKEGKSQHQKLSGLIHNPLLIFLFLTIFLYVGSEIGVSSWISEYYVKVFGSSATMGAFMVSIFWTGILIGRLSISLFYHGYRQAELLLGLSCLALISLILSLSMGRGTMAGLGFFISGLGYSAIYPVVMALVGEHFRRGQSVALGIVSTGGGIGSFSFPFIMAAIANSFGIQNGFWFYSVTTLGMAGAAAVVVWLVRGRSGEEHP